MTVQISLKRTSLQRGLLPVTFEPRWNGKPSLDRTASRGRAGTRLHLGPDYIWEAVSAFPGLKGAPRAWDTYSAKVLTSSMQMKQSQYDGCFFYRFEPSQEHIEEKAGRHIDDFLVTGQNRTSNAFWNRHEAN